MLHTEATRSQILEAPFH